MNFFLQIIPYEETVNPKATSTILEDSKPNNQPQQIKKKIVPKSKSPKPDPKEKSNWNPTESKRYLKFLIEFQPLLQKKEKRKLKLNVKMSKVIKSRDPSQCHSHHQKMLLKYGSITEIIKTLEYLIQEKKPKDNQIKKTTEEMKLDAAHLEQPAVGLTLEHSALYAAEKQEEFVDLGLMELESYQYDPRNNWDNYFI